MGRKAFRNAGLAVLTATAAIAVAAPAAGAAEATSQGASADGSRVFFHTVEPMVPADTDDKNDIYERSAGTTKLVSAPGAGASGAAADASLFRTSADGTRVVFITVENLVAADTDGAQDLYERSGGATTLVSAPGVGASGPTAIAAIGGRVSDDGSRVFFVTFQNLVGADTDGLTDIYERSGGVTTLVSAPGVGATPPDTATTFGVGGISADGSRVFFRTPEKLVAADTDGVVDVYERSAGTTTLLSAPGAGATPPDAAAFFHGSSTDGSRVFFSTPENLVAADTDGEDDVYERSAGTTTLISAPGVGATPPDDDVDFEGASADGTRVFFGTDENLVAADIDGLNDLYERSGGTTTLVSAPGVGASGLAASAGFDRASSDGSRVFFTTSEKLVGADTDANEDIYQGSGGVTTLISTLGIGASGPSEDLILRGISQDGSQVFWDTDESMAAGDTDGLSDVYEHSVGFTTLVSAPGTGAGGPAVAATFSRTSLDGARVFFNTAGQLLGTDLDIDNDVYQRSGGATILVSVDGIPPETTITSSPKSTVPTKKKTAAVSFGFSSSEAGSSFQCKLDGAAFAACISPRSLQVKPGKHTFQVRALDVFGNADASPATNSFTVKKKKAKKKK
ncbi:MAG: hypothetical protein EXQ70_06320 [Solirubrobacterales bacterium]|nr:hypothetical protein [Solirubrobacterales bacterium]